MIDTQLIDQQGMSFIKYLLSRKDCIVNEYHRETGLDAICEIREAPYLSSGLFFAIQLKSGESYFQSNKNEDYVFYADEKHISYWLKCYIPVLFVICNPEIQKAYWINIDKNNLINTKEGFKIIIPKANDLESLEKKDFLSLFYGKIYDNDNDFQAVLDDLRKVIHIECNHIKVSALELFINGLCDRCRQLYFFTDVYNNIIENKLATTDNRFFGMPNCSFYDEYFYVLNYHNILMGTFEKELEDINKNKLLPFFMKHLSKNGLAFLNFLRNKNIEIHDRFYVRQIPKSGYIFLDC